MKVSVNNCQYIGRPDRWEYPTLFSVRWFFLLGLLWSPGVSRKLIFGIYPYFNPTIRVTLLPPAPLYNMVKTPECVYILYRDKLNFATGPPASKCSELFSSFFLLVLLFTQGYGHPYFEHLKPQLEGILKKKIILSYYLWPALNHGRLGQL